MSHDEALRRVRASTIPAPDPAVPAAGRAWTTRTAPTPQAAADLATARRARRGGGAR
ncbi:hypothetical protein GCM10010406_41700 [Streptomyces thermolineatus]|uniref:Uncharacterized protein n=1 Tax=Streptomyces thermolineatus TaxID=44033 RepID=A0ABP5ZP04_9ACTN